MTWNEYFAHLSAGHIHESGDCVKHLSLQRRPGSFALGEWYTVICDEGGPCLQVRPVFGPDKGKVFTAWRSGILPRTSGL